MKKIFLMTLPLFLFSNFALAEDVNEKYFIAYNVSQNGMLSENLRQQTLSTEIVDEIAVLVLKNMKLDDLAFQYYQKPDLQNKLRVIVKKFILSQSAGQLFDNQTTELLNKIYTMDELKILYQHNKSVSAQKFIQANMEISILTQEHMQKIYQSKFDKTSANELNQELEKVFMNLKRSQNIINE